MRSWWMLHPWRVDPRDRDPEAWRDGLRAGLHLWRAAESGDPMALTMREAIEQEDTDGR